MNSNEMGKSYIDSVTYFGLTIHKEEQFDWVDVNEMPDEYKPTFLTWMRGQTAPLIKNHNAVYRHDFERWYELNFLGKQTYWD